MNTDDIKEEIRRRVDIAEVIGQYVPLQRAGTRLRARCPFHQERTPSFYVDPDRGFWKCFGCGEGGDLFSFVMKMEGATFPEAAERLAQRAGLEWRRGPEAVKGGQERQTALRANEAAAEFFQQQLRTPAGAGACEYLEQRGLTADSIAAFQIGFAPPGWDNLLKHLAGKGFDEQSLEQAGLVKRGERGGHYDVFRNRIIFPIVEVSGRLIAFGGRTMDPDDPAKYLNSPDTAVFRKGNTVYGLNLARQPINEQKKALVVEGYMDVIALAEAGFGNVVACLGTSTTEAHLRLLARYADEIIFIYDADAAGMRAALRNAQLFEATSADAKIATLPEGQDPDDCVRQGGPAAFQRCLDQAVTFVEYQIRMAFAAHDPNSPDGRLRAAREAVDVLVKVRDRARREEMLERTADWWARDDPARAESLAKVLRLELRRRQSQSGPERGLPGNSPRDRGFILEAVAHSAGLGDPAALAREQMILGSALGDPELCRLAAERLTASDFVDANHREIARVLFARAGEAGFVPSDAVSELSDIEGLQQYAVELRLRNDGFDREEFADTVANLLQYRGAQGLRPHYKVSMAEEEEPEDELAEGEDFESLRRRVVAAITAGELGYDDPDYIRYSRLSRRFRGKGQRGFIENAGQTPLGATPMAPAPAPGDTAPDDGPPEQGD